MKKPFPILDETDYKILRLMQQAGRITNAKLAKEVGISAPAMLERVKRLEQAGVINGYCAKINPEALGYDVIAWVSISLSIHQMQSIDAFLQAINELPEVLECYHVTGEEDFMLKVMVHSISDYEDFILHKIARLPGINKMKTSFVLSQTKDSPAPPLTY
jgi:Lrp/AsnC family leucine-responsive transcriptional regulator